MQAFRLTAPHFASSPVNYRRAWCMDTDGLVRGLPSLQGAGTLAGPTLDLLQHNWAPGTQALVAAAGLAAIGAFIAAYARR